MSREAEGRGLGPRLRALAAERPLLTWVVVLAAALVLYLRVVEPLAAWTAATRQQAATLAQTLAGYQAQADRQRARLERLQERARRLADRAARLPAGPPSQVQAGLERDARGLARQRGLEVAGSLLLPPRTEGGLVWVGVRLTLLGDYPAVLDFLAAWDDTEFPRHLAGFTLAPAPGGEGLRLECQAATLLRRAGPEAAS
jgi:hypothetical protein